jgi:hypothetical protein
MMQSKIHPWIQVFELVNVFGILSWCFCKNLVNQYLVFVELQGLQNQMVLFIGASAQTGRTVRVSSRTVRAALAATLVPSTFMVGIPILPIIVSCC